MFFHPVCPHCQKVNQQKVGDTNAGREILCPNCHQAYAITVPEEIARRQESPPADADDGSPAPAVSKTTPLSSIKILHVKPDGSLDVTRQITPAAKRKTTSKPPTGKSPSDTPATNEAKDRRAGKDRRTFWLVVNVIGMVLVSILIFLIREDQHAQPPGADPRNRPAGQIRDPARYDNFNNPAFDGRFDEARWQFVTPPPHQATQQNGVLKITKKGMTEATRLAARKYRQITFEELTGNKPTFIEARFMLDGTVKSNGLVQIQLIAEMPGTEPWFAEFCIQPDRIYCMDGLSWNDPQRFFRVESVDEHKYKWHLFWILIEPKTMTFSYFLNGVEVGTHIPAAAQTIRGGKWTLCVGVWSREGHPVTGYIDYVGTGQLNEK